MFKAGLDLDGIIFAILYTVTMIFLLGAIWTSDLILSHRKPYNPKSYCMIEPKTDARSFDFCTNVFKEVGV